MPTAFRPVSRPPMEQYFAILFVCGLVVLATGLVSGMLHNHWAVSGPIGAVIVGFALGPYGLGLIDLEAVGSPPRLTEEIARLALAMALMATALRLPSRVGALWRAMTIVLLLLMPAMWLASTATAWLFFNIPFLVALLIGGILSPTDPVLAGGIITGNLARRTLPYRLRHLLSAEAAANDGLALLFVMLPVLLLQGPPATAITDWLVRVLIWEVGGAMVLGWIVGGLVGWILVAATDRQLAAPVSLITITVALTIAVLGLQRLLHMNGILGVFVAGVAFGRMVHPQLEQRVERVQETARTLLEVPVFLLLGLTFPIGGWIDLGWPGLGFALAIMLVRRLPWFILAAPVTGFFRNRHEAAFLGWFGPVGIAAAFYALVVTETTGLQQIWPIISLVVFVSVVAHGVTATPWTKFMRKVVGRP